MILEFFAFIGKTIASKTISKAVDTALPEVSSYFEKSVSSDAKSRPPRTGDLRMVQSLIGYDHSSKELKKSFVCQIFENNAWSNKETFSDQQDCLNYMAELQAMQEVIYMDNQVGVYCRQESAKLPDEKVFSPQMREVKHSAEDWFKFIFSICFHGLSCVATVAAICYAFWHLMLGGFMLLIIAGPFAVMNYEIVCYEVKEFTKKKYDFRQFRPTSHSSGEVVHFSQMNEFESRTPQSRFEPT